MSLGSSSYSSLAFGGAFGAASEAETPPIDDRPDLFLHLPTSVSIESGRTSVSLDSGKTGLEVF